MAAPALAQTVIQNGAVTGTTVATSFLSNTTTGNTYLIISSAYGGATLLSIASSANIVVSSGAATFSKITSQVGVASSYPTMEAWIAYGITGGTTPSITVTYSGTIVAADLVIYEWTNVLSVDGAPITGTGTCVASVDTLSPITTSNANDVLFAADGTAGNVSGYSSGWPGTPVVLITSNNSSGVLYDIVTATVSAQTPKLSDGTGSTFGYIEFALSNASGGIRPHLPAPSASTFVQQVRPVLRPDVIRF